MPVAPSSCACNANYISIFPDALRFSPAENNPEKVQLTIVDPRHVSFEALVYPQETFPILCSQGSKYQILINGNYFDQNKRILGLLISKGKKVSDFSGERVLSGIFIIDQEGNASIIKSNAYNLISPSSIAFALQAGPRVIEKGGLKGINSDDGVEAERTIIAVLKTGEVLILTFQKGISLFQAQEYILTNCPDVDIALNLDGGPSTASCLYTNQAPAIFPPRYTLPAIIKISPKASK